MTEATVVVPTHDHGPTLVPAVKSALAQTIEDLEVFIVGDGMPGHAKRIAESLAEADPRVRFFDNPKGPRHGEIHRREAIRASSGRIICYLADDDLYLPDHVQTMATLLSDAEFANTTRMSVDGFGRLRHCATDLAEPELREALLRARNRIGLTQGAHTRRCYDELPYGWRTTPAGVATDHYMWQQILHTPDRRAVSGLRPTSLSFPSGDFVGWRPEERRAAMERWAEHMKAPGWRNEAILRLLVQATSDYEGLQQSYEEALDLVRAMSATLAWRTRERLHAFPFMRLWRAWRERRSGR